MGPCECCFSQRHPDLCTSATDIIDRIDRFMSAFNKAHAVFGTAVSIPQRAGVKYNVFEGSQADAYLNMKFKTKKGSMDGSRTIGINPYMVGFADDESVADVMDASQRVGFKALCQCILSLGCLYLPFIKAVQLSKLVFVTTSRRIIKISIFSPASDRVLHPDLAYSRVVESFFEPCKPIVFAHHSECF